MKTSVFVAAAAAALARPPARTRHAYRLRLLGDPILTTPATPVMSLDSIPTSLVETMRKVCIENRGLGLSAQQVGGIERIALATIGGELVTLINPRYVSRSDATERDAEGCLSIPGFRVTVGRHCDVTISYLDDRFSARTLSVSGLEARCVQHEMDHLEGKLLVDGATRQQRRLAERLVAKARGKA